MRNLVSALVVASAVVASRAHAAEICGNGIDDDADGLADEGCYPTLTTGQCESPLSCGDTGMVSPSTGSLRYSLPPDIAPRVPYGPGIGFRRFYVSQYAPGASAPAYRKSLGERWGHTYATWIDAITGTPAKAIWHTPRGQDILFTKTSSDATWDNYTPQAGHHYKTFRRRIAAPNDYEIVTLTGDGYAFNGSGRLTEVRDSLVSPNRVLVTYDGSGNLSTVTDAQGKRRLLFGYTGTTITSVAFQILISAVWTTQHTTSYVYTTGNLTAVTIGGQTAYTNNYTSNYLTSIVDGDTKTLVAFSYDSVTAGKVVRVDTPRGVVGYEYASTRANCSGKTVLHFHKGNTTSCNVDADCGAGFLCGGKTGTGATGQMLPRRALPHRREPERRCRHHGVGIRPWHRSLRRRLPRRSRIHLEQRQRSTRPRRRQGPQQLLHGQEVRRQRYADQDRLWRHRLEPRQRQRPARSLSVVRLGLSRQGDRDAAQERSQSRSELVHRSRDDWLHEHDLSLRSQRSDGLVQPVRHLDRCEQ